MLHPHSKGHRRVGVGQLPRVGAARALTALPGRPGLQGPMDGGRLQAAGAVALMAAGWERSGLLPSRSPRTRGAEQGSLAMRKRAGGGNRAQRGRLRQPR